MYGLAPFFTIVDQIQGFDGRKSREKNMSTSETLFQILTNDVNILVQSNNINI